MKKTLIYIALLFLVLVDFKLKAQTDTEFWFVNPEISTNHGDDPIIFVFTTRDFAADVTIEMPAEPAFTPVVLSIPAYTTDFLPIVQADPEFAVVENTTVIDELSLPVGSRDNIGNKAILITSTAPINVYFTQDRENNSDIYALKGANGIGTEFIIPFQEHAYNQADGYLYRAFSSVEIISYEDGTVVEITPPAGKDVYRSGTFPNQTTPFSVTIDRGEVYTLPPGWDPTVDRQNPFTGWWRVEGFERIGGVIIRVTSGSGVAVIKKDDSARRGLDVGASSGGWDIIADQWVPYKGVVGDDNDILGTEYVAMRGQLDNGWEWVYAAAPEDNTRIWWGNVDTVAFPVPNAVIDRGEQVGIQFDNGAFTNNFMEIISNKPLSVLHVSGDGTEMGGAVLPPISKCTGSTSVTIARSVWWPVFLNIMVRAGAEDDFLFEGVVRNDLIDPLSFVPVGSTGDWMATQITVAANDFSDFPIGIARTISNTQDVFHLGVVHGGGPGCRFGYFSDFNELTVSANTIQGDGSQPSSTIRACKGDTVQLFASGGSTFNWWPSTNLSSTSISNPKAVVDDFRTYFVEVSGACNTKDTATVTIEMAEQPEAVFFVEKVSGCAPLELEIRNLSTDVNQIYWDYNITGIGGVFDRDTTKYHPSIIRDIDSVFTHTFFNTSFEPIDSPEVYNIQLKVKATKCVDTINTTVTVYPDITADFTLSDLDDTLSCNPAEVDFLATALSINEDYYKWSFGDGALSAAGDTVHEYVNLDPVNDVTYTAQLVVRSEWFCRDTAYQDFTIHPYLEGGFTIDKDEGCSPLSVRIDNISSGADSIFLDYGDGEIDTLLSFSSITHIYSNNDGVDEVDTNIVVMRVKNDEGCEYTDRDTIFVYPEFIADYTIDGNNYEGCNSRTVTLTNATSDGTHLASRYLWEFADGTSMDTTNNAIQKLYNNTTSANKTYDFRLTARSIYGCTDDTTNTITIYRAYANFTVDNNEGCSPVDVNVSNISVGDQINSWVWDYGDGIGTSTDENPFQYTYNNAGTVNDTNYLVLEVTEPVGGCSTTDTARIVVYPEIQVSYTENLITVPGCDSLVVEFNSTLSNPALPSVTYEWSFGDGGSSSAADTTHVYKNLLSSTSISRAVNLHVETDMGCFDDASSNIIVNPMVDAKIFIDKSSGCSPLTVDVVAQNYPGISNYSWDYGDILPGTSSFQDPTPYPYPANQSYAPQPGGDANYELILEVDGSLGACTDSDTVPITIYSEIVADFTPDVISGCNPLTVNFTDNSSANAVAWSWDFDDGSTSSDQNTDNTFVNNDPFTKPFDVTLDVTSDRGCVNSDIQQINVLPYVEANFDINISEDCSPLTITITNNSLGSGTEWYWYWDKDDRIVNAGVLAAADSIQNFPSFTKTYINNSGSTRKDSLTLIVGNGNGCYQIFKRAITVHSTIDAQFTMTPLSTPGCNPFEVQFTNTTINGDTYNWDFGDGSSTTIESPSHIFINNLTSNKPFDVRMTAESTNGCTDFIETTITVYSKVISAFSIATREDCPPFTATIDNTSIGNAANTYQWFIDNVLVGTAPTNTADFIHVYNNTLPSIRDYQVKLVATNPEACTSEHIDTVRVYEHVEASFSMNVDNGCSPLEVDFTNLSSVPASTTYNWDFGDGATSGLSDLTHTFYNSSRTADLTRTVYLTVESANNCSDDTSMTVDIYHKPLAKFFIDNTSDCPPLESTLIKQSEGEDMFEWRFDDGNPNNTTDANLSYSWQNTDIDNIQTYRLELWVGTANNCRDSSSLDLSVFPRVIADFNMDKTSGCSPLENVQFTNASTSPATQFFWSFGDGTTTNLESPVHDFANVGSVDRPYKVLFHASSEYNCDDTISKEVTVYVDPKAEFYVEPVLLRYPSNIVNITNKTNSGPFTYLWDFDDGDNFNGEIPNNHLYEHWGEYAINLTVNSNTSSCSDRDTVEILILPPDVNADFTASVDGVCLEDNQEIQFTAFGSQFNEEYIYTWDFGDGTQGEGQNVSHTYNEAGTYYVEMTAKSEQPDGGEDYEYKTIRVYKNPEANFDVLPTEAMLDPSTLKAQIKFYNTTACNDTTGCVYSWDFGDESTANSKDVTHYYSELGNYEIKLTAINSNGCTDSLSREVDVIGAGEIQFPNAFTPSGDGYNKLFNPVSEGVIEYELMIYNRWGELLYKTNDLSAGWDGTVKGNPGKPDVYVWKAKGKFSNGRAFELAGDVTLIR